MRQIQIAYNDTESFLEQLQDFKRTCVEKEASKMMFQIYSEILEERAVAPVGEAIEQVFPGTPYIGCSTSGNLVDCQLSPRMSVVATIFDYASTQFQVFQYDSEKLSVDEITESIANEAKANLWVKAIEMYFTIPEGSYTRFCDGLKEIRGDIQIFGGVACSDDITSDASCVWSSAGEFSASSILVVFYGGEEFFVDAIKITGWKPLGRKFCVTKSDGSILQELDGIPAYDVYRKYLNINNDENFFYNTLEFPLFYEHNDTTILRVPVASNEDRSITMSSDIELGSTVQISYGDPRTIVESIAEDSERIRGFSPDLLHIFSCAARRTFWTSNEPTYELEPFRDIASSVGFFSHGEFIRTNGCLNQHNVTLVVAAMREGQKAKGRASASSTGRTQLSKVPLVSRLATFISATSLELAEKNEELKLANENLQKAVITDGLTGLYNRAEIQRRISESLRNVLNKKFSLVMLDIDNFKQVNDTYGHQEGDRVIITLADILRNEQMQSSTQFSAGRWGGEEFMLLLSEADRSAASLIAELIRRCFASTTYPVMRSQTVSIGVTQAMEEDTIDTLCTRVDTALYEAKKDGKNRVAVN